MGSMDLVIYHDIFSKHNLQIRVQNQLTVALLLTLLQLLKESLYYDLQLLKENYALNIHLNKY